MVRGRMGIAAAAVAVIAGGFLAVVGATGAGASNCSAPSGKCYLVAVSPQPIAGESQQPFTVTVTDEATTQSLGSVQITAPTGFAITSAPGGTVVNASTALFLNLGINAGKVAKLTVYATVPCSGGESAWGVAAKQSNDFNGTGNDFVIDTSSTRSAAVTGSCSLTFVGQPNNAEPSATITSTAGPTYPVAVEVLDGETPAQPATSSTAPITLTIGTNAGNPAGALSVNGTPAPAGDTVSASNGVAYFPGISINEIGFGYTLAASSPAIPPAVSSPFDIALEYGCTGGTCSPPPVQSSGTTGTLTTSSDPSGKIIGYGFGGTGFTCGSSTPLTDPLGFDLLRTSGTSVTALFKVSLSFAPPPGRSLQSLEICFVSTVKFTTLSGAPATPITINGIPGYIGELPTCPGDGDGDADDIPPATTSCVLSRHFIAPNDVVTFQGYGDMGARGW